MAYDQRLADRVRAVLAPHGPVVERRMMGALCFMIGGHMCCGVTGAALMVRVGKDGTPAGPHVRPMEIGGRTVTGFILVDQAGVKSPASMKRWVGRGVDFVANLPRRTA